MSYHFAAAHRFARARVPLAFSRHAIRIGLFAAFVFVPVQSPEAELGRLLDLCGELSATTNVATRSAVFPRR